MHSSVISTVSDCSSLKVIAKSAVFEHVGCCMFIFKVADELHVFMDLSMAAFIC